MKNGFTLVELAIVIIILGILITGIVGGQSLIESANRQNTIATYQVLNQAVLAFKLEYDAIPGDFDEAEDYWPGEANNGTGDNIILDNHSLSTSEYHEFWRHLNLANITKYDLSKSANDGQALIIDSGKNVYNIISHRLPVSKFYEDSNLSYQNRHAAYICCDEEAELSSAVRESAYTAKYIGAIDKKIDNGLPWTGKIISQHARDDATSSWHYCYVSNFTNNPENLYRKEDKTSENDIEPACVTMWYLDF
jgi:prepilin-type N-terminal cleavage/methylation domain-containing protein